MRFFRGRGRRGDAWAAALFLAPALLAVLLLRVAPGAQAVVDALQVPNGWGLGNFSFLLTDPDFLSSLRATLLFSVVVNPLQVALALALAVLLDHHVPAASLWRTLLLLPTAVPQSVSAVLWGVVFRPDGPLNGLIVALGLPAQPFLTSTGQALGCIVVAVSWIGVGYWMTFLVAGLKDIPAELGEAASIDGATRWQRFWHVTLPQLRRPLLFVLVADTVANVLVFAPVQIMTGGGPQGSTDLIMNNLYTRAFVTNDIASAAAQTLILVAVVMLVVALQFRLMLPRGDA